MLQLMKQFSDVRTAECHLVPAGRDPANRESHYDHRLHAVLLVAEAMSGHQVAQMLGDAARTVTYWVTRFEERGFSGLMDEARPGRTQASAPRSCRPSKVLRKPPGTVGLSGQWDGTTLSQYLQRR